MEAMVPVKTDFSSLWWIGYDEEQNEEAIKANLDLIKEWEMILRLSSPYQKRMKRYFNYKVHKNTKESVCPR